jgi:hypothetical protein
VQTPPGLVQGSTVLPPRFLDTEAGPRFFETRCEEQLSLDSASTGVRERLGSPQGAVSFCFQTSVYKDPKPSGCFRFGRFAVRLGAMTVLEQDLFLSDPLSSVLTFLAHPAAAMT